MTTYEISGYQRRKLKFTLRALRYQQKKWGFCEIREARIKDIERSLDEKVNSGERNLLNHLG